MIYAPDGYATIREKMQPGDVIAFGGKSHFSEVIKWATRSSVSHVGVILQTVRRDLASSDGPGYFNQIIESTTINDFSGVIVSKLSKRIQQYEGEIWWLPLSDEVRARFNSGAFIDFMMDHEGRPYDLHQAITAGLEVPGVQEDFGKFFCSELVVAGLEAAGAIPPVNSSEFTPISLCRLKLFNPDMVQIKGPEGPIRGFNTLDPFATVDEYEGPW